MKLRSLFALMNYSLGAILILLCFKAYAKTKSSAPLYIASAVILVGPIENLLNSKVEPGKQWIVDQVTSIGFLVFLILAVLSLSK
jgi:hypothetical protein